MLYADVATSPRRNAQFLTPAERSTFAPSPSEAASRALWVRMGVRLLEQRHTKVSVYLDGNFSYGMLLEAGESIPADGGGITYRVMG